MQVSNVSEEPGRAGPRWAEAVLVYRARKRREDGRPQLLVLCRAGRRAEERSRAPRPHHSWGWQPNLGHFTLTEGSPVPTASCSGEALPSGVTCVPDDRIFARHGEGQLDSVYVSHEILILLILLV